jgi:hypothetical protein
MGVTRLDRSVLMPLAGSVLQRRSYHLSLSDPPRLPAHAVPWDHLWLAEIRSETHHSTTSINSLELGMIYPLYLHHND